MKSSGIKQIITCLPWILAFVTPSAGQDTLLLFHPTTGNLEILGNLVSRRILPLEEFHVKGVYHALEEYDYSQTIRYAEELGLEWVTLVKLAGAVEPGGLFGENRFTELFGDLFRSSRGALFMGGPDIPPQLYGAEVNLLTRVTDPYRHYLELSFMFHLLGGYQDPSWEPLLRQKPGYVVSGICLGMQTLNVATGGTLIQDIPTEIYGIHTAEGILALPEDRQHRNYRGMAQAGCAEATSYHFHRIRLTEGSFLADETGFRGITGPLVLSSHHQAVDKLGRDLEVAALSMDGMVVEAIRHNRFPHVIGVQFHPEKPGLFDPSMLHSVSCSDSISFHAVIRDTPSYEFHLAYWKYLARILKGGSTLIRSR